MVKRILQLVAVFGLLLFTLMGSSVLAAGIGVHPQTLEINQIASQETQTEIFIYNTTEEPALYQVYPDNYSSLLRIDSTQFRLEGGESRALMLNVKSFPPGEYSTSLSVVAEELSEDASLPKTGIKIPIKLNVHQGDIGANRYLIPIIVGLFLLALILFVVSMFRYSHISKIERIEDMVEERFARRSYKSLLKHYLKHHRLVLVSMVSVIVAIVLLLGSFVIDPSRNQVATEGVVQNVVLELQSPDGKSIYQLAPQASLSPFSALEVLSNDFGIPFTYDPPQEMGVFVTSIGGYENGTDGQYWVYEINNKQVPMAADRTQLHSDDRLLWKFETPSEVFHPEE